MSGKELALFLFIGGGGKGVTIPTLLALGLLLWNVLLSNFFRHACVTLCLHFYPLTGILNFVFTRVLCLSFLVRLKIQPTWHVSSTKPA